jgi:hypothetical protein
MHSHDEGINANPEDYTRQSCCSIEKNHKTHYATLADCCLTNAPTAAAPKGIVIDIIG